MKQLTLVFLLSATALFASAEETEAKRIWLVATHGPAAWILDRPAGEMELGRIDSPRFLRTRSVGRFRHVDGFIAELTAGEAAKLSRSPRVRFIEPNYERRMLASATPGVSVVATSAQDLPFGISMIGATDVWPVTRGRSVKVGVIDTGIDYVHPDLAGRYRGGRDFVNRDDDPRDDNGHGTHVAGTIAANDNDFGVVGAAPEVDLYALKVLDDSGSGNVRALIEAVEWAIDHGLDVINLSLGSDQSSVLEKEAFAKAEAAGIIAVAASGNSYAGLDKLDYPAGYASVVSVGAIDASRTVASFSQRGSDLDFVAPGVGVHSTVFTTFYGISTNDGAVLRAQPMAFSPGGSLSGLLVDCGIGAPGDFPSSVAGQIALIRRGELTFAEKSTNAKAAGAKAVVVYNHIRDESEGGGVVNGTLGSVGSWILTVGTSRSSGEYLLSLADRSVRLEEVSASDYAQLNGTSMASPHVAAAVALLRSLAPGATRFQIVEALRLTAKDLGTPGRDNTYGSGLIDVHAAARSLDPSSFSTHVPRRRATRRP